MKQLLQELGSGETRLVEIPKPAAKKGEVVIQNRYSVVSPGTERMLVEFGKSNLIQKALSQPERVKEVLAKAKTDGVIATAEAVKRKLDDPIPLGYSSVGVVIESGCDAFAIGDRVVSNGNHAEFVRVPQNLCARVPDHVQDEDAAFTVVSAIALHAIRLSAPTLGETFVVTGLGLIGLLTVQILKAQGCRVMGVDPDLARCRLAKAFGADVVISEQPDSAAAHFSRGRGVDGVIVTASSSSHDIMHQAAQMCRKRGRIILVGVVGLNLSRQDFYEKELTFQVSCSYGPGRYDPDYEDKGKDYPLAYVRWTEQRNFEAVLDLMESGSLSPAPLVSRKVMFSDLPGIYSEMGGDMLGVLVEYDWDNVSHAQSIMLDRTSPADVTTKASDMVCGVLGAGNYATSVLLPALRKAGAGLDTIVASTGISAERSGQKYDFRVASTDELQVFENESIDTVIIATRHDLHARQTLAALEHGKHVFVEKPLALNSKELDQIQEAYERRRDLILMVGFNRRFSPLTIKLKDLLSRTEAPKTCVYTVNAGEIPQDHWTQDRATGGGRILGEACHFIDYLRFLIGHRIRSINIDYLDQGKASPSSDTATISMSFDDGSIGTIHYFANGGRQFPKERVEVFCDGGVLRLNNFLSLESFSWPGSPSLRLLKQDKGQSGCTSAFVEAVKNGMSAPISFGEIVEVSQRAIEAANAS